MHEDISEQRAWNANHWWLARPAVMLVVALGVDSCPLLLAQSPVFPAALKRGDKIAIVAPAGSVKPKLTLSIERYRDMGFEVQVREDIHRKWGYLAGSDEVRAAELMDAYRDKSVRAIICARGGYGAMRILDRLDYDVIRKNPKILTGFSDITALHLAVYKKTGQVTFHSPIVTTWGMNSRDNMHPLAAHYYWRALLAERYVGSDEPGYLISATWPGASDDAFQSCQLPPPGTMCGGVARGRLIGGNLSLVAALSGTPYEMDTDGCLLFLEDVGEAPYRVDRMLQTLKLSGKLGGLSGVILGSFQRNESEDTSGETRSVHQVLEDYFGDLGVPVVDHFPVGHQDCNVTLPVGVLGELNADRCELRLLENPVSY